MNVNSDFNYGYIYFRSYCVCISIVLFESGLRLVENGYKIKQNIKNAVQAVFQGEGGGEKGNIKCSNPKRTIEITALNSFVDNNPSFKNFS